MDCLNHQKLFHMNEKKKYCLTAKDMDIDIPTFEDEIKKEGCFDVVSMKHFIMPQQIELKI